MTCYAVFFSSKRQKEKTTDKIIIGRKYQKENKDKERVRPRINKYGKDKIKSRRK